MQNIRTTESLKIASIYHTLSNRFLYPHVHLHGVSGTMKTTTFIQTLNHQYKEDPILIIEYNSLCFYTMNILYKSLIAKLDFNVKKYKYLKGLEALIEAVNQSNQPVCFLVKNVHELEQKHLDMLISVMNTLYSSVSIY
jgi:hypothetical protein